MNRASEVCPCHQVTVVWEIPLLMETLSLTKCFQQTGRTDQVHSNHKGGREMEVGYWNDVIQQSSSWSSAPATMSVRGIVQVSIMRSREVSKPMEWWKCRHFPSVPLPFLLLCVLCCGLTEYSFSMCMWWLCERCFICFSVLWSLPPFCYYWPVDILTEWTGLQSVCAFSQIHCCILCLGKVLWKMFRLQILLFWK